MDDLLLEIEGLSISLKTRKAVYDVIKDVSFSIAKGELLGIVGESGSGKSITSLAVMDLLPAGFFIKSGRITFESSSLISMDRRQRRSLRGSRMSMIFQDPLTALNPLIPVGMQIAENLMLHNGMNKKESLILAGELLEKVGIENGKLRLQEYPHHFSGGMRQRVMIAMAISCHPSFIIADEPTTALDVTVQASVMNLLKNLCLENGMSLLLISHNLALVKRYCDRIAVMYAGQIVESAPSDLLFSTPSHPYTSALIACLPSISSSEKISSIEGAPPSLYSRPQGCPFHTRCSEKIEPCTRIEPLFHKLSDSHTVRCHLYDEG